MPHELGYLCRYGLLMRTRAVIVLLALALAGCATTGDFEAGPEVIAQPTPKTADEAVAEGEAAKEQPIEADAPTQQAIRDAEIPGEEVPPRSQTVPKAPAAPPVPA